MNDSPVSKQRLVIVAVIAGAVLLALVIAMGNPSIPGSSTSGSTGATPTSGPATSPPALAAVKGTVGVKVQHLGGHTWRFLYTVRDTGKEPIAGFQLNGDRANLFHIIGHGWNYFGNGVCGQNHPGLLIYWSTNSLATNRLNRNQSARFGFDVNTTGPITTVYSLSWGTDQPQFGRIQAPAPSTLKASGPCH